MGSFIRWLFKAYFPPTKPALFLLSVGPAPCIPTPAYIDSNRILVPITGSGQSSFWEIYDPAGNIKWGWGFLRIKNYVVSGDYLAFDFKSIKIEARIDLGDNLCQPETE